MPRVYESGSVQAVFAGKKRYRPTALGIHIFAGGFSLGVRQAGYEILAHLEDTNYGVETARRNFSGLDIRVGEANWREAEFAGKVDLVYSNPPCFSESTAVLSERGWRRIGDIVRERSTERVACVDGGRIGWREVGGWHKNPYTGTLYDIRLVHGTQKKGFTLATINHKFLTRRGWVPVGLLTREDEVCTGRPAPNRDQQSLIDGMLLGDGKLSRQPQFSTSQTCEELVRLKHAALRGLTSPGGVTVCPKVCSDGLTRKDQATFTCATEVWTRQQRTRWYPDGGPKRVPADLVLTDIALAAWYMDDGRGRNLTHAKVMNYQEGGRRQGAYADFAVCGFDEENAGLLVRKLAEVGLMAEVRRRKTGYLDLRITRDSAREFFHRISRFVPSSMRYKLPADSPPFDPHSWDLGEPGIGWDRVTRIPARVLRRAAVYCIDVPGPQNFITKNGVVHNCAIFSSAGISTTRGPDAWRDDPRLNCWYRAWRVFEAVRPKVFALESVTQAYTKGREVIDEFTAKALTLGYSVTHLLLSAKWAGVPQDRKRFFFVAYQPWLPAEFRFDWANPPTVGDALAETAGDPGDYECGKSGRNGANPAQWIPGLKPGRRLTEVFDERNPDPERNKQGKRVGRPSFNCRRLVQNEPMGAFVGNFYIHPTEDRFLGVREMKVLCGYPPDYWLEGNCGGHASLLARAVLPPVGYWLADSLLGMITMAARRPAKPQVVLTDLREPPGVYKDLTVRYLPDRLGTRTHRLVQLSNEIKCCDRCPRMRGRMRVFGQTNGNPNSPVLFVGEAPGRKDAGQTGLPFYGDESGVNFEILLTSIGFRYEDVFITNAVLCNPLGEDGNNSFPQPEEIANCSGHLKRTILFVNPRVVIAVGNKALEALNLIEPHQVTLAKDVARPTPWYNRILVPVYHPSPRVVQTFRSLSQMKEDFRKVKQVVGEVPVSPPVTGPTPDQVRSLPVGSTARVVSTGAKPARPEPQLAGQSRIRPTVAGLPAAEVPQLPVRTQPLATAQASGDDSEQPLPGEGSGKFIQRLWMTGRYTPEDLVRLVHANWQGRTTRVGDVYYNYRKLLDAGIPDVPPWPRKVGGPGPRPKSVTPPYPPDDARPDDGRPRLLLTGSTPIQVGSSRTQLKILTAVACWRVALEEAGYHVDWRPVLPGEDLSAYNAVVVSLTKPNSIGSNAVHGALWCLSQRPDAVLAFDDWQVSGLVGDLRTCAKVRERLFKFHGDSVPDEFKNSLYDLVNEMAYAKVWRWPAVVPVLGDHDVSKLKIPAKTFAVDPTSFAKRYRHFGTRPLKARRWIQASLLQKPLPALGWPVDGYGWRATSRGLGGLGDGAQPRIPEPELASVYLRSWGVLSPAHPHAGSGWWRVRYLMAADAHCVLSADPREAACLGEPYLAASDPRHVEQLTDDGLRDLARAQRERLAEIIWPKERVLEILGKVLTGVVAK